MKGKFADQPGRRRLLSIDIKDVVAVILTAQRFDRADCPPHGVIGGNDQFPAETGAPHIGAERYFFDRQGLHGHGADGAFNMYAGRTGEIHRPGRGDRVDPLCEAECKCRGINDFTGRRVGMRQANFHRHIGGGGNVHFEPHGESRPGSAFQAVIPGPHFARFHVAHRDDRIGLRDLKLQTAVRRIRRRAGCSFTCAGRDRQERMLLALNARYHFLSPAENHIHGRRSRIGINGRTGRGGKNNGNINH